MKEKDEVGGMKDEWTERAHPFIHFRYPLSAHHNAMVVTINGIAAGLRNTG